MSPQAPDRLASRLARMVPRALFELAFAAVTFAVASPLLAARHLPLQDLPQHLAAISVLRRLPFSPVLREYFVLALSRTQYLLVYVLGVGLSYPFGVEHAGRILALVTVASLPYALRFVLRRTGGDERLAALAWPLAWNPQMLLGFLNFLLGVPVALLAVGLFADRPRRRSWRRQSALAVLALATFYSHLIPFGVLGLGVLLLLPFDAVTSLPEEPSLPLGVRADRWANALLRDAVTIARETLFLVPSLVAAVVWVLRTPATDASVRAGGVGVTPHPEWPAVGSLPRELSNTLLDFPGDHDERALLAWGLCLLAALAMSRRSLVRRALATPPSGLQALVVTALPALFTAAYVARHRTFAWIWEPQREPETSWGQIVARASVVWAFGTFVALGLSGVGDLHEREPSRARSERERLGARLAWLPVVCAVLYVCTPSSYGWIWPIHTRFAVTAALLAPLLVAAVRPAWPAFLLTALLAAASCGLASDVGDRFGLWERTELGDLDAALSRASPDQRLVALVPAVGSGHVPNIPLLHVAAYYQVRGGAVAAFSFVDFPQSPFRYREDGPRPPRLPPRWEWQSDLRVADPELNYYDYVLARRGMFDVASQYPDRYERLFEGEVWNLYRRRPEPPPAPTAPQR